MSWLLPDAPALREACRAEHRRLYLARWEKEHRAVRNKYWKRYYKKNHAVRRAYLNQKQREYRAK